MRELAGKTIVLLKNEGETLPLHAESLQKVAIIGGNAKGTVLSGGGSAALKPSFFINPYEGITAALKQGTQTLYAEGARTVKGLPTLEYEIVNSEGGKGFDVGWYSHDSNDKPLQQPIETLQLDETNIFLSDARPSGITERWTMKLKGSIRPRDEETLFEFGIMVAGRAKLYIDGTLVVDNWTLQRRGNSFFNTGTEEERGQFLLQKGVAHEIYVEFCNVRGPAEGDIDEVVLTGGPGLRVGAAPVVDETQEIENAVAIARDSDVAIVVVGLSGDWETEGHDRTHLKLPGKTDELIKKVAQVNPKTIVVLQAVSFITFMRATLKIDKGVSSGDALG